MGSCLNYFCVYLVFYQPKSIEFYIATILILSVSSNYSKSIGMAQQIGCAIVDEEGELIIQSELNFNIIYGFLWKIDPRKEKYPWLISIDDCGDTTFNWKQFPYLLAELEILSYEKDSEKPSDIKKLVEFIKSIEEPHHYLKFLGD